MSLIADALRKAGGSPATPPLPGMHNPPPRSRWIYAVALIGLAVLAFRAWGNTPSRTLDVAPAASPERTARLHQANPQPLGLSLLRTAENQWRLNGTVRGGQGKALALIDDQVVEEGGSFRGAKVVRVSQNESDGEVTTLKIR
ncbi:MAG: hypothetical protein HYZ90_01000 [Candidatus Omnitrophica bacterium]|nr:hypothetical protein [Candidatus Omnitrophota bacterium]